MFDRIEELKAKYIISDAINKIDDMTMDVGADMVIAAQDVTDEMMDTLQVDDLGGGNLKVSYKGGEPEPRVINIKLGAVGGKKMITAIEPIMN